MNDPKPNQEDQRISAFIDGELRDDELARFEALMTADAEFRQLVDELRGIGKQLKRLPRQQLSEDLTQRILRQAERELLQAGDSAVVVTKESSLAVPKLRPRRGLRRGLGWAAAAIVTALLLGRFMPKKEEMALAPQKLAPSLATPKSQRDSDDRMGRRMSPSAATSKITFRDKPVGRKGVEGQATKENKSSAGILGSTPQRIELEPSGTVASSLAEPIPTEGWGLVVRVALSDSQTMEQTLKKNGIIMDKPMEKRYAEQQQNEEQDASASSTALYGTEPKSTDLSAVDMFLVQATRAQIDDTLANLKENFDVTVELRLDVTAADAETKAAVMLPKNQLNIYDFDESSADASKSETLRAQQESAPPVGKARRLPANNKSLDQFLSKNSLPHSRSRPMRKSKIQGNLDSVQRAQAPHTDVDPDAMISALFIVQYADASVSTADAEIVPAAADE